MTLEEEDEVQSELAALQRETEPVCTVVFTVHFVVYISSFDYRQPRRPFLP